MFRSALWIHKESKTRCLVSERNSPQLRYSREPALNGGILDQTCKFQKSREGFGVCMIGHDVSPHGILNEGMAPGQGKEQLQKPERRKRQRDTAPARQSLPRVAISHSF